MAMELGSLFRAKTDFFIDSCYTSCQYAQSYFVLNKVI